MNEDLITYRAWTQTLGGGVARPVTSTILAATPERAAEFVARDRGDATLILIQRAYAAPGGVHPIYLYRIGRTVSVVRA